jgi:hypothetical protein
MPVAQAWLLEHQIIYIDTEGDISLEELQQWDQQSVEMLDASPEPRVHAIFDHTRLRSQPSILHQLKLKVGRHPKVGWVVIIRSGNPSLLFISSATSQFFRVRLHFCDSLPQALTFLQEHVPNLPDLSQLPLPKSPQSLETPP